MPFARRSNKGVEGSDWVKLYDYYREMSKAAGARKLHESQNVRALWNMKAAEDRRENFYDPDCKDKDFGKK